MKKLYAYACTDRGVLTAHTIKAALARQDTPYEMLVFANDNHVAAHEDTVYVESGISGFTKDAFQHADAILYFASTGIAVRQIAPFVSSKETDPAVIVLDESGSVVIPLLSGHLGGAVALAETLAQIVGARALQTTATDVRGVGAVDSWAVAHGHSIENPRAIVDVTSAQLSGERVGVAVTDAEIETPFEKTLWVRPKSLVVGVGSKRDADKIELATFVKQVLAEHNLSEHAVCAVTSIDLKADEPALISLAEELGVPFVTYSAAELQEVTGSVSASDKVRDVTGVDCVCERAALRFGGERASLVVPKQVASGLGTCAVVRVQPERINPYLDERLAHTGWLSVVGIGPGGELDMTKRAHDTIAAADIVVGYTRYIDLVLKIFPKKRTFASGMKTEISRCAEALKLAAQGKRVALVCSGDAGVYGMASLVYELKEGMEEYADIEVDVVPGVTALLSAAAEVGAPFANDFCSISLSNLLTPWEVIEQRLRAAAAGDFAIALYNPKSKGRPDLLSRAAAVLSETYDADKTRCAWVKNSGREGQEIGFCTLRELGEQPVDMLTVVLVGMSETRMMDGKLVTPRGYSKKEEFPA